jgi:membrane fusion protein (multidrug efflux system)
MRFRKKHLGFGALALLMVAAAAGVYARINASDSASNDTVGEAAGDLPDVSAASAFGTDEPIPVEGAEVLLDTLVLAVSATGQAAAERQTAISALLPGQVRAVRVTENGRVAAGAVLVELDSTEYRLALDEAQARLRQAEAQYQELTLFDERIEDAQVRAGRERAARARSGLDAAEVAVRRAELDLLRTRVTAPFAGRIANVRVVPGQTVRAGDELVTVSDMDPIRVEVQVLESEVGFLSPGRDARVTFAAFPGELFPGRIISINPVVAADTRTARVTVAVPNPGGRILPGFYARVSLDARRMPDRVLVPRSAILERDRRTMLFVFEGDGERGRAKWRYVTTGLDNGTLVEIVENPETDMVAPGEVVLVGGHQTLTHDAPVRLTANARTAGGRPD